LRLRYHYQVVVSEQQRPDLSTSQKGFRQDKQKKFTVIKAPKIMRRDKIKNKKKTNSKFELVFFLPLI
jgi:hypothetical protein